MSTLINIIEQHLVDSDNVTFYYLKDGEQPFAKNYPTVVADAKKLAAYLTSRFASQTRVLLIYPPGLDFISSFLGCLYAGMIAVPAYPLQNPRHAYRLHNIIDSCEPGLLLGNQTVIDNLEQIESLSGVEKIATESLFASNDAHNFKVIASINESMIAFLQYTSGSTGKPKGVMVSHGNLMSNLSSLKAGWGLGAHKTSVLWLPFQHDLGLIGGVLSSLYNKNDLVLLPPVSVIEKPYRWLKALTDFKAYFTAGPNFAYQLCAKKISAELLDTLDLSSVGYALAAAEPNRYETMEQFCSKFAVCGFKQEAYSVGYGLAENTLHVTTNTPGQLSQSTCLSSQRLAQGRVVKAAEENDQYLIVSAGTLHPEHEIVIVDPITRMRCAVDEIGEIWVYGRSVASGYWANPEATQETFQANINGENKFYLRTGDLGFIHANELYVTGRQKDLIIIDGRNIYPQDLEAAVDASHEFIKPGCSAAFSVDLGEKEGVVVCVEIKRTAIRDDLSTVVPAIRHAIASQYAVAIHEIKLLKPNHSFKTTSGKIQRKATKAAYVENKLECMKEVVPGIQSKMSQLAVDIHKILTEVLGLEHIEPGQRFSEMGGTSIQATILSQKLQDYFGAKVVVSPTIAYDYPTLAELLVFAEQAVSSPTNLIHESSPVDNKAKIAIIGVGCHLPGKVRNLDDLWAALANGVDAIEPIPKWRWDIDAYDEELKSRISQAGILEDIDQFDAAFFNISPKEARQMDPQHRLLLEVVWEALENAVIIPQALSKEKVGVYIGSSSTDYKSLIAKQNSDADIDPYFVLDNASSVMAGRIAYYLGTQGAAETIDTACSSSLVAVDQACQALQLGNTQMAIVGSVNVILYPENSVGLARANMLSPTNRCHTFCQSADGYVRAEGCAVVILKRLDEALKDGDIIHAVIQSTTVNQDGASSGLTVPNVHAQKQLLQNALAKSNLNPNDIDYIEAHGSATVLGDPIEFGAINAVFGQQNRPRPLYVGSIKSNMGHLEAAAGMAGLLKTIAALKNKELPANINLQAVNNKLDLDSTPIEVVRMHSKWHSFGQPRRAGVSAFGFSGTNAHVILEEAPNPPLKDEMVLLPKEQLFVLSAKTKKSLVELVQSFIPYLEQSGECIADICYTSTIGRSHFSHRLALMVTDKDDLLKQLKAQEFESVAVSLSDESIVSMDLKLLAAEYLAGKRIDWNGYYQPYLNALRKVNLPTYCFDRQRYWLDIKKSKVRTYGGDVVHELLGAKQSGHSSEVRFINQLDLNELDYLNAHAVYGHVVFPGAAFIESALAAGINVLGTHSLVLREVFLLAPLALTGLTEYETTIEPAEGDSYHGMIYARYVQEQDWVHHADFSLARCSASPQHRTDLASLKAAMNALDVRILYEQFSAGGLVYGDAFQSIQEAYVQQDRALAAIQNDRVLSKGYVMHPALLDGVFQTVALAINAGQASTYIPSTIARMDWYQQAQGLIWAHVHVVKKDPQSVTADINITDNNGMLLSEIKGFVARAVSKQSLEKLLRRKELLGRYLEDYDVYALPLARSTKEESILIYARDEAYTSMRALGAQAGINGLDDLTNKHVVFVYEEQFSPLVFLVKRLLESKPLSFTLVTQQAYCINSQDKINSKHTQALGFWKSLQQEANNFPCYLIDRKEHEDLRVFLGLIRDGALTEPQLIVREQVYVPRLLSAEAYAARHHQLLVPEPQMYLASGVGIDTLYWAQRSLGLLAEDELRVRIVATALNFRDVLKAMNLYPGDAGDFGYECAGEVLEIGANVQLAKPGNRVIIMGEGLIAGEVIVKEVQVALVPEHLSFEQASAIPIVFLTANYGLNDLAKIKKGQKVLIHAASGGVGLAAIEFAKSTGAVVYATASTLKQAYLKERLGIEHVYDSRSLAFGEQILADTQGEGVDVVLNSLTSEGFIEASLGCLKTGGVFLEIGKINVYSTEQMEKIRPDVHYHLIEIDRRMKEEPEKIQAELRAVLALFATAELSPLPITTYPVSEAMDAFHYMQQAKQIGKVVLSAFKPFAYTSTGTYLITGGTGGLGLELAKHLLENGVQHLALTSRNKASAAINQWIAEQQSQGISITHYQADVVDKNALATVFAAIAKSPYPLKGIFHAAGIIKDGLIKNLSAEDFDAVLAPKVIGSLHLHELSHGTNLDCFVLFSSVAALLGSAGQANYAAANAFMDGLARMRCHQGLLALSINWGAFAKVGMAVGLEGLHRGQGMTALDTHNAFAVQDELLAGVQPCVGVVNMDWSKFAAQDRAYLAYLVTPENKTRDEWPTLLEETLSEQREPVLIEQIKNILAEILNIANTSSIDANKGFFDLGMDSLMSEEFKTILQTKLGSAIKLKNTVAFDYPSAKALAGYLLHELALKEKVQASAVQSHVHQHEEIAIIGLSGEFPGAENIEAFWNLLVSGEEGVSEVPASRWPLEAYYDPNPDAPGKMIARRGGFIQGIEQFDAGFFSISPKEANYLDPQQRLLLKHSWLALESAGISPQSIHGSDAGVFVGISTSDYKTLINQHLSPDDINAYIGTGNASSTASGRISYFLGLQGPNLAIDTACSSSLVALNVACERLLRGECGSAIVGGVNALLSPELSINFSKAGMLAPDGKCKTFDEQANGYVRGEGCGVVVLKRLSDALRDNNPIWAVIKSSGINQDGASSGLTVPSGQAQERLLASVLAKAQLSADDIDYLECHGTGTKLGDPIEVHALGQVYGQNRNAAHPIKLGSVKTNIGHLEAAAGIAGLIKVALALKYHKIPAHLHFTQLNSKISLTFPAEIVTKTHDWQGKNKPRRAAVSSFGFSGTNAHVILEEAPAPILTEDAVRLPAVQLFVLSAKSAKSLAGLVHSFIDYLEKSSDRIEDICYTAALGRNHFAYRLALIVNDKETLLQQLKAHNLTSVEVPVADELIVSNDLSHLAAAYLLGKRLDWQAYYQPYLHALATVILPGYCFDTLGYWFNEMPATTQALSAAQKPLPAKDYVFAEWEPMEPIDSSPRFGEWAIVHTEHNLDLINLLAHELPQAAILNANAEEHDAHLHGIIYPLSANNPEQALDLLQEVTCFVQKLIVASSPPKLILLTQGLYSGENLAIGSLLGFIKSVLQEYPLLNIRLLDTDELSMVSRMPEAETFMAYAEGRFYRHRLTAHPQETLLPRTPMIELLHKDASYLITGGLGALGQVTMKLLLEKGAKQLILVNRHAPNEQAQALLDGLAKQYGAQIQTRTADVSNKRETELLIKQLKEQNLKGIFHLAGVLNDKLLGQQTKNSMELVFLPKAMGAWYLHQYSQEHRFKLDYFVLFSSIASSIGSPGQSNYAAANSFLDQLAKYRNQRQLAATSIAWGPWEQMGMAKAINPKLQQDTISLLSVEAGLHALNYALEQATPFIQVANIDWDSLGRKNTKIPSWLAALVHPQKSSGRLAGLLKQAPKEQYEKLLHTELTQLIKAILGLQSDQNLSKTQSFIELGMDSLMALEFKNHLQEMLGEHYSLTNLPAFQQESIGTLIQQLIDGMKVNQINPAEESVRPIEPSFLSSQFEHGIFEDVHHDSFNKSPRIITHFNKLKILFLHGTAIDSSLTQELMGLTSWINSFAEQIKWTFIDGPYKTPAVPLMFQPLYSAGKYVANRQYCRWDLYRSFGRHQQQEMVKKMQLFLTALKELPAEQIGAFLQQLKNDESFQEEIEGEFIWRTFAHMQELTAYRNHLASVHRTLAYIQKIYDEYGPFDGISGMCEGASIAGLFVQQVGLNKIKLKNNRLKFLLSLSGWKGEGQELEDTFYQDDSKIMLPSLHICGKEDSAYAQTLFAANAQLFNEPTIAWHSAGHVIPELNTNLQNVVMKFIDDFSGER